MATKATPRTASVELRRTKTTPVPGTPRSTFTQKAGASDGGGQGQSEQEQNHVCLICLETVVDDDDALLCEGVCDCWHHRQCASVTKEQYIVLSNSKEPFSCPSCTFSCQKTAIGSLRESLKDLADEVRLLKATVATQQLQTQPMTNGGQTHASGPNAVGELAWNVVAAGKKGSKGGGKGNGKAPADNRPVTAKGTNTGFVSPRQQGSMKTPRVSITGARKIWGTLKATTTAAGVANALKVLAKVPPNTISIKRKYKTVNSDSKWVTRWWFVVRRDEKVLEQLQDDGEAVRVQTAWKLEPLLEYDITPRSTYQPQPPCPQSEQPQPPCPQSEQSQLLCPQIASSSYGPGDDGSLSEDSPLVPTPLPLGEGGKP